MYQMYKAFEMELIVLEEGVTLKTSVCLYVGYCQE